MSNDPYTRPLADEVFCHKNDARVCNASCVAFLVTRPKGDDYEGQSWAACSELVSAHRSSKSLNILASTAVKVAKEAQVALDDQIREGSTKA